MALHTDPCRTGCLPFCCLLKGLLWRLCGSVDKIQRFAIHIDVIALLTLGLQVQFFSIKPVVTANVVSSATTLSDSVGRNR